MLLPSAEAMSLPTNASSLLPTFFSRNAVSSFSNTPHCSPRPAPAPFEQPGESANAVALPLPAAARRRINKNKPTGVGMRTTLRLRLLLPLLRRESPSPRQRCERFIENRQDSGRFDRKGEHRLLEFETDTHGDSLTMAERRGSAGHRSTTTMITRRLGRGLDEEMQWGNCLSQIHKYRRCSFAGKGGCKTFRRECIFAECTGFPGSCHRRRVG